MSDIQKIIEAIAAEIDCNTVQPHELYRLSDAMNGVAEIYHMDIAKAAFNIKEENDHAE